MRDEGQRIKKLKINEFQYGLRPDLSKIGRYVSNYYAGKKNNQNALAGYGQVDLILTGAFSNSLFVFERSRGLFYFDGTNTKTEGLKSRYGTDIMGLNQNTFNQYQIQYVLPQLRRFIKSRLGQ